MNTHRNKVTQITAWCVFVVCLVLVSPVRVRAIELDKTVYHYTDRVYATTAATARLTIYDMSTGEYVAAYSNWNVGDDLTFGGVGDYSAIETTDTPCDASSLSYSDCKSLDDFVNEFRFSILSPTVYESQGGGSPYPPGEEPDTTSEDQISVPGGSLTSYRPEITITAPKDGAVFSHAISIGYNATDKNDLGGADERTRLGFAQGPVSLYYTDSISDWDHSLIAAADKMLIATSQPSTTTGYLWQTSDLLAGHLYRIIVDAIDAATLVGENISGLFTVDYSLPQYTVSVNPPATHGEDVTISVDASKDLAEPPQVLVTQVGVTPVLVAMKGTGTHYEGTYTVTPGHDGIATITVAGKDAVGNTSSTIVSGGTFAVGVNPPPAPHLLTPHNNDITGLDTVDVSGTTRADTTITAIVNGTDPYTATLNKDGTFAFHAIKLSKTANRGANVISVVAHDAAGLTSASADIHIKYNIVPTVTIARPDADAVVSGTVTLAATAHDDNNDPLQFTYQVVPVAGYDATVAATSTVNAWQTIADLVPTNGFSWDSTQIDDGEYYVRVMTTDGISSVYSEVRRIVVKNTLPYFRFEDGRKTITNKGPVTIVGRALEPTAFTGQANIAKVDYSLDNGKTWKAVDFGTVASQVKFSATISDLTAEGTYQVIWRIRDSRRVIARTTHTVVIDATPPSAPLITSPRAHTTLTDADDADSTHAGMQVDITGSAEAGSVVTLSFAGASQTAKAEYDGSFHFRSISGVTRGVNSFTLTAADEAGNVSTTATGSFIYDNPPVVAITQPKPFRGLKGLATVAWTTTDPDNDPIQNVTLSYRRGSGDWKPLPIDPTKTAYQWDVSKFVEAADYQLKLEASDGFVSSHDIVDFSVDNTLPTLATFSLANSVLGKSQTLKGSGTASDALSGVEFVEYGLADPTRADTIDAKGEPRDWFESVITKGFLQKTATFSIAYPTTLEDGTYQLFARAVDGAGNVSAPTSKSLKVDTMPPHVGSFAITKDNILISPDRDGAIEVYPDVPVTFGVSLEADTASASLSLDGLSVPLHMNSATGLWEASVTVTGAEPVAILLSAEDQVHNKDVNIKIGTLSPLRQGAVIEQLPGGRPSPVTSAHIKVLQANESNQFSEIPEDAVSVQSDGSYALALPAGTYQLVMNAPGYRPITHTITLDHTDLVAESFLTEKLSWFEQVMETVSSYLHV